MKIKKTGRGFELIEFDDYYHQKCSLQQSSLALYVQPGSSAIWLGVDVNMKGASVGERMHLTKKELKKLIPHLQAWVDTGSFKIKKVPR